MLVFFFQAEDGIRDTSVTGVQTCALPISRDEDFVDRGVVHAEVRDIPLHFALNGGIGDLGRRGGGVEPIRMGALEIRLRDVAVRAVVVIGAVVLGDDVVLAGRSALFAERFVCCWGGVVGAVCG